MIAQRSPICCAFRLFPDNRAARVPGIALGVLRLNELLPVAQPLLFNQRLGALTNGGVQTIVLITALFGWLQVCLLMGARLKAFREEDFVHAAQTGVKAPANPSSAT